MVERMFTPEELSLVRHTDELGWLFILDNKEFMTGRYGFRSIFTEKQWERECSLTPYASTIPGTYIEDELMRLSAYKKIAEVQTEEDQSEVIDELLDRFGEPPKATLDLISIARIKAMAQKCGITRVHRSATHLVFEFAGRNGLTPDKIADLLELYGMRLLIHGGVMPFLKVSMTKGTGSVEEALQVLSKLTN